MNNEKQTNNDKRITFRLSTDLYKDLVTQSGNNNLSVSDLTRLAIEEKLGGRIDRSTNRSYESTNQQHELADIADDQSLSVSQALSAKPADTIFGNSSDDDTSDEDLDDADDSGSGWLWAGVIGIGVLTIMSVMSSNNQ